MRRLLERADDRTERKLPIESLRKLRESLETRTRRPLIAKLEALLAQLKRKTLE